MMVNGLEGSHDCTTVTVMELESELWCTSKAHEIWSATRGTGGVWTLPAKLQELNTNSTYDTVSPAVSADGTTIYLSSNQDGVSFDIYRATRGGTAQTWNPSGVWKHITTFGDESNEAPGTTNGDGSIMIFSAIRPPAMDADLYEMRGGPQSWGMPALLVASSSQLRVEQHPSMTADGLTILFDAATFNGGTIEARRLFIAHRPALNRPFESPEEVSELNNGGMANGGGWLSPDGSTIYFVRELPTQGPTLFRAHTPP